jgi:predicted RNase H-like nuclease (RuvC/YqgF family)
MTDNPIDLDDIGKILNEVLTPGRRRTTGTRRKSTSSRSRSSSSTMDAAVRRAVRAELEDVTRALRDLTDEVERLRRANEALADKVARLTGR